MGVEHRRPADLGIELQCRLDREGRHLGHRRRHPRHKWSDLGDALGGVGGSHHRDAASIGDRIHREGLLGEGGADQGHHAGVDQAAEGIGGGGLVAAAVFYLQPQLGTLALEVGVGQLQADALVLADHAGVAGEGDRRANRGRALGPIGAVTSRAAGAGGQCQGQGQGRKH